MESVVTEEFFGLNSKIYLILVINSSEYKKAKRVDKNVVTKTSQNEYKDVLLNKTCFRHSVNRSHRIRT